VAGAFAFGLMSKPMVVTLPFVLLLLDYWPLARPNRRWPWLIAEKLPLIGMAIAVSVVTYIGQRGSGAVVGLSRLTPDYRAANAVISYGEYLRATVAPVDLAVYYPFEPHHFTDADVLLAVAVLVGATLVCMRYASRAPYLPVGWLWFVGTLVPVIGIVQAGGQARADRFVYVPHLGLFVLLVWGAADLLNRFKVSQQAVKLIPGFVLLACVILTWRQVGLWRTNTTIWTHTLEVTGDRNAVAETNLGIALAMDENRLNDALPHLKRGAELDPENALPLRWYGVVLAKTGRPDQAIEPLRGTLKLDPTHSDAQKILASILFEKGRYEEAVEHLAVIETSPRPVASARTRLGSMLVQRGNLDDARDQLELAATDDPGSVEAHTFLGICELLAARYELAEARLREALGLDPKAAMANAYLGTIQAYRGQWPEAVMSYEKATAANPKSAAFQAGLGLALTGAGRGWDAKAAYGEAFKLDPKWAETTIAMFWHQQSRPNPLPVSADTWAKVQAVCEATDSRDPRAIEALAAVRAAEGKFSDAEQLVRKAAADADQAGLKPLADQFRNQADRYKAGKTHRDPWP
jgi:protein O-mannosyl-transferase